MNGDMEMPVRPQRLAVRILKGMGLFIWAILSLVCYNFGITRLAEWAQERYGVEPWPFILLFGLLLLPLVFYLTFG